VVSKGQVIRPLPSRFNTDLVVQSESQLLSAAKVSFRRVDGHVAEQKLDLIELAACQMAETRTRTSHAQSNPSISRESLTSVGHSESVSQMWAEQIARHLAIFYACHLDGKR
jgi:hypothetical protein